MNTSEAVRSCYIKTGGNISAVARELGITRATVYYHVNKQKLNKKPLVGGRIQEYPTKKKSLPKKGVKRYIVTSAQNNTRVHDEVWRNLCALAKHYEAELMVGTFTYNKQSYGPLSVKKGTHDKGREDLWYDDRILPHVCDHRVELADTLVWCGEMNILPTAKRPLSGFETYTGVKSGIFPHTKFALESIATSKNEPTKFNYTTGCVTQRNYLQKKAGLSAEFHHGYGGLLVEVCPDGVWFVRQLNADDTGTIHDLTVKVSNGVVTENVEVEAITWGDIHCSQLEPWMQELCWDEGGMLDQLKPKFQFLHDIFDGYSTNHHESKDPHTQFKNFCTGWNSVTLELNGVRDFLYKAWRPDCETVVVDSNHDYRLERWLKEHDYRRDPANALLFLRLQLRKYEAIHAQEEGFFLLEYAVNHNLGHTLFLKQDQSFRICGNQIECGIHGHFGANGSKGTTLGLSKIGRKANTAHTHSAQIIDGLYVAGVSASLDQGYNRGASSWSHSHIVTYPNGKRCVITIQGGRWKA